MSAFEKFKSPAGGGSTSFAPTVVSQEKYARVTEGRNRFFSLAGLGIGACGLLYLAPLAMIRRSNALLFRTYCQGKVLDLSPKLNDATTVALFESTKAVRVEFLVKDKSVADEVTSRYEPPAAASEDEEREKRQTMTLVHLCRYDPIWVASPVTFDVADEKQISSDTFTKYDSVIIRNELCNVDDDSARAIVRRGLSLLRDGGHMIVCEVGRPRFSLMSSILQWFHDKTGSSFHLTRDYPTWLALIGDECGASVVQSRRTVMGSYHAVALRKR